MLAAAAWLKEEAAGAEVVVARLRTAAAEAVSVAHAWALLALAALATAALLAARARAVTTVNDRRKALTDVFSKWRG